MTNQMNKKSGALNDLLSEITPKEQRKTDKHMQLAMKIDEGLKARNWKKKDLAEAMGKQKSVITKWLSGAHKFNTDTLMDIEEVLNIKLLDIEQPKEKTVLVLNVNIESEEPAQPKNVAYPTEESLDLYYYIDVNKMSRKRGNKSKNETKELA